MVNRSRLVGGLAVTMVLGGCGGLGRDSSCEQWADASAAERSELLADLRYPERNTDAIARDVSRECRSSSGGDPISLPTP